MKNVRCTSTRKETERKTEHQVERLGYYGKCGVKGGGRTGQDKDLGIMESVVLKEEDALDRTKTWVLWKVWG